MRVTGWSNGHSHSSGAGYGLRIRASDRDRWFDRSWDRVEIDLDNGSQASVRLSKAFWGSCTELRSVVIGRWLLEHGLAPWPRREPPVLTLRPINNNKFELLPPHVG